MVNHAIRRGAVKRLRAVGLSYDLSVVSDNASKAKVLEMADGILQEELDDDDRAEAEAALEEYKGTWPADTDQGPTKVASKKPQEWFFHAAQLTYNGSDGRWASKDVNELESLFNDLRDKNEKLAASLDAIGYSVTLERSLKEDKHVHGHAYFHLRKAFHRKGPDALQCFIFDDKKPHVKPNTAKGSSFAGAMKYGHFYVFVDKIGSLHSFANYLPFQDYGVEGWWLDNLLKQGKLTKKTYLDWAAKVTVGFQKRLTDTRAAERYEREAAVSKAMADANKELEKKVLPMKIFLQVEAFIDNFGDWQRFRRPILVIVGGTNLGKSLLAAHILQRIGKILQVQQEEGGLGFLEVTVEDNEVLDLADFDRRFHAGVILDGVGDALILKRNRESLQGRPKASKGAKSATNVYAYSYTFTRRAVIATLDLSAKHRHALGTDHWLSNELNVIKLELDEKVYVRAGQSAKEQASGNPPSAAKRPRTWVQSARATGEELASAAPVGLSGTQRALAAPACVSAVRATDDEIKSAYLSS